MIIQACTLRQLLNYNPETGVLIWRKRNPIWFTSGRWSSEQQAQRWNTRYAGREAFTATDARGYNIGAIFNKTLPKHRVAWAVYYGEWPKKQIDHIDGNRTNNKICNLREVSNRQNSMNSCMKKNNTSGFAGVTKHRGRWRAHIKVYGKQKFLGYFETPEEASEAYKQAKTKYGFSQRHGTNSEP